MFPEFTVLDRTIGTYGLLSIIGLFVCATVAYKLGKKYNIQIEDIILIMISIGIGLFFGGHLLYAITNFDNLVKVMLHIGKEPISIIFKELSVCFGGSVFYGGFIGAVIALLLHTKFSKSINREQIFDIFSVCIPLFHVFGRIGCALGGCCYGIESEFGYTVYNNSLIPELNGVNRFPVQLTEAAMNLIIFLVLLFMYKRNRMHEKLIYCYMIMYPIVRFVLEFLRGDDIRGIWFGLSTSQWISIILFVIAVVKLIHGSKKIKMA